MRGVEQGKRKDQIVKRKLRRGLKGTKRVKEVTDEKEKYVKQQKKKQQQTKSEQKTQTI